MFQILSYIKFLLKSTSKHGIHSPFVYQFTSLCLEQKPDQLNNDFNQFIKYSNILKKNKTIIKINDFGAGSKIFKSDDRRICDIAKYAGISKTKAKLLIKILDYFKPTAILELGTSLGLSTLLLSKQNQAKVTTIEACKKTLSVAKNNLNALGIKSVNFVNATFETVLPQILKQSTFDLIYFDGNHKKSATIQYFKQSLSAIHNDSFFIFDDIYLNAKMQQAWLEIIQNPKVTVSIDLFHYGLVFFRAEQIKQHFYIRTNS